MFTQPAIISQLMRQGSTQTNLANDTVSHQFAGRISNQALEALKSEASLLIPAIGHYTKGGEGYEWSAKISDLRDESAMCSFVFNDYEGAK